MFCPVPSPTPRSTVDERRPDAEAVERKMSFRPSAYWYMTTRCNLQCRHCSVQSSPFSDVSHELDTQQALVAVERIRELNPSMLIISGGEPLVRSDFCTIFEALIEAGVNSGIETNGLLFTPALLELLHRADRKGLYQGMTISLDGGNAEAHEWMRGPKTFGRTLENMRLLTERGITFDVQCVLHRANVGTLPSLFREMAGLKPRCLILTFLLPIGRGLQMIQDVGIDAESIKRACQIIANEKDTYRGTVNVKFPPAAIPPDYIVRLFGGNNRCDCTVSCRFPPIAILPNGNITICQVTRDDPNFQYGNVTISSLVEIWKKAKLDELRNTYLQVKLSGICSDCIFARTCRGSCRAFAFEEFGDFTAPHPLCDALDHRGEFPAAYRLSSMSRKSVKRGRAHRA